MVAVLALIGVVFLFLAGVGVAGPRFVPGWLGLAFVALAVLWAPIVALAG
jgi:hypothetical protein